MNYYGTPDAYPSAETMRQADLSGTSYPKAYAQYDDNYLYIPTFTGKIVAYIKIDKRCIMDAIKHWESIENKSNDCSDDLINKDSDIRFDNVIVKGVLALNNREYKEEKEISDDE